MPSRSLPHPPPVLVCNCLNDGKVIALMQLPNRGPPAGKWFRSRSPARGLQPLHGARARGCGGWRAVMSLALQLRKQKGVGNKVSGYVWH